MDERKDLVVLYRALEVEEIRERSQHSEGDSSSSSGNSPFYPGSSSS